MDQQFLIMDWSTMWTGVRRHERESSRVNGIQLNWYCIPLDTVPVVFWRKPGKLL